MIYPMTGQKTLIQLRNKSSNSYSYQIVNTDSFDVKTKNTFWGNSNYSILVGRVIQLFRIETFQTVLAFLPPIPCPITKCSTACEKKTQTNPSF